MWYKDAKSRKMKEKTMPKEREELKNWLKHGDLKQIANACEVDRDTVYRWFLGESNNANIELVVRKTVEFRKNQAEEAARKIGNIQDF